MKLIGSKTSPYVRKARVVLAEKNLPYEMVEENVWNAATSVTRFNPLTKVPVLALDDGECLYDSSVITEYLDSLSQPALIPPGGLERARARRDESLADGICDAAVGVVLERKREALRQDAAVLERHRAKVEAGIAAFAKALDDREWLAGDAPRLPDLAAGCALFYVEFRLPEVGWRSHYPNLRRWAERLEARPSFSSTRPPAA
jgi:glutathione S-transferase